MDASATAYRVTLRKGDPVIGIVEVREPSGDLAVREVHGASCDEVAGALELVVAMDFEAHRAVADAVASPTAGTAAHGASLSPVAPDKDIAEQRASGRSRTPGRRFSVTAGVGASGAFVGPQLAVDGEVVPAGGEQGVSFRLDARLGASLAWASVDNRLGDAAQFRRASGFLDLCVVRLAWGSLSAAACVRAEGGALHGSGSQQTTRPWWAAGALGTARWRLGSRAFVQAEAGAAAPLVHDRFLLDGDVVYAVPAVAVIGGAALGTHFP
jgi:hypothetical protein